MVLRSGLEALWDLDLEELFALQQDIALIIENKVQKHIENANGLKSSAIDQALQPSCSSDTEDAEDLLLTQIDPADIPNTLSPKNKGKGKKDKVHASVTEDSSPLKGITERHLNSGQRSNIDGSLPQNKRIKAEVTSTGRQDSRISSVDKKINFNINPITLQPWILEDFRINEHCHIPLTEQQIKIESFYRAVGQPSGIKKEMENKIPIGDDVVLRTPTKCSEITFDNLRNRIESPPGFGRLDFPSTQEGFDDKRKSQEIIKNKTRQRFLEAVNYKIPPYKRLYLFKVNSLNSVVDDNKFHWEIENLSIFSRT